MQSLFVPSLLQDFLCAVVLRAIIAASQVFLCAVVVLRKSLIVFKLVERSAQFMPFPPPSTHFTN